MSDHSKIEWTDATWNIVLGCDRVSSGCDGCYAIRTARRMESNPHPAIATAYAGLVEQRDGRLDWTGQVNLVRSRLDLPLHWTRPRRIFVNAQSDLFHADVTDEFIGSVFEVMAQAPQHTFQILTKRPARMRSLLNRWAGEGTRHPDWAGPGTAVFRREDLCWVGPVRWPLPNVHLGVSVEDQPRADLRIPALLATPAAVRWLSCEPLLGQVDLRRVASGQRDDIVFDVVGKRYGVPGQWQAALGAGVDWVVAGGESGPGARPMHPAWPRQLRDQCIAAAVPFHFKQWGEYGLLPRGWREEGPWPDEPGVTVANDGTVYQPGDLAYEPEGPRYREAVRKDHGRAQLTAMYRAGKKAAGRELDGRTWDEFPVIPR